MRDDIVRSPVWLEVQLPRFAPLEADVDVDVAVIGGGLTGLTTAWLLAREGRRVALFERDRLAAADTGHTSAHLTCVTDLPLHEAVDRFGEDTARALWEAGTTGIELIARTASELQIDCAFRWTPGYLHAAPERVRDAAGLRRDAELATQFGLDATFLVSVPGVGRPGVRFGRQAVFHPRCYAAGLARSLATLGGMVHEDSVVEAIDGSPPRLTVNGRTVRCRQVVVAAYAPFFDRRIALPGAAQLRERLGVFTSFVIAAELPAGTHPAALYWDTGDPYEYLRVENTAGGQRAILGGGDVPVRELGEARPKFDALQARLLARMPGARPTHAWSGEVVQSEDGMPYVGDLGNGIQVATGFCGNGFTLGSVAATLVRDACLGQANPLLDIFDPLRPRWRESLWQSLSKRLGRWSGTATGGPAPA